MAIVQTRMLIVDDHYLVRKVLELSLDTIPSIKVVGVATPGHEPIERTKLLQPDVILMDAWMPQGHAIEAIASIKRDLPQIKIIVVIIDKRNIKGDETAIDVGADVYLTKDADEEALLWAIEEVWRSPHFTLPK